MTVCLLPIRPLSPRIAELVSVEHVKCATALVFFFSSRRRHTRFDCDWSSDVCSSDLIVAYVSSPLRAIRQNRDVGAYLERIRERAVEVVEIPKDERATLAIINGQPITRSEEHTSELQSQSNLVCRLLLEKKKTIIQSCFEAFSRGRRPDLAFARCCSDRAEAMTCAPYKGGAFCSVCTYLCAVCVSSVAAP